MRRYKRFPRAESSQQIRRSTKPQKHSRGPKSRRKALGPVPHSAHPVRKIRKSPRQSRRQPPTPSIGTGPGFYSGYVRRTLLLLRSNGPATSWQTRGCPCNSSFILSFPKAKNALSHSDCARASRFFPTSTYELAAAELLRDHNQYTGTPNSTITMPPPAVEVLYSKITPITPEAATIYSSGSNG